MSFEDNRQKFNHFIKVADADNESETVALIDELFAENYVLHTGRLAMWSTLWKTSSGIAPGSPLVCDLERSLKVSSWGLLLPAS
jgi:hypothetical protein